MKTNIHFRWALTALVVLTMIIIYQLYKPDFTNLVSGIFFGAGFGLFAGFLFSWDRLSPSDFFNRIGQPVHVFEQRFWEILMGACYGLLAMVGAVFLTPLIFTTGISQAFQFLFGLPLAVNIFFLVWRPDGKTGFLSIPSDPKLTEMRPNRA